MIATGVDAFNALAFGAPHQGSINYFQQSYNNLISNTKNFVGDTSQAFINKATQVYNYFNSPEAIARIKNVLRHSDKAEVKEYIYPITSLEEARNASLTMQRWVMAEPYIRSEYIKQRLDGYSDTYELIDKDDIKDTHYDYQLATNGVMTFPTVNDDDDLDDEDVLYSVYHIDYRDGDSELSLSEQVDIRDTWELVKYYIDVNNEDPTNPLGGELG